MKYYAELTKRQADSALQEFLAERPPALEFLRAALQADAQDPHQLLDGSVESLAPVWEWTLSQLSGPEAPGATDPASVPREAWPTWERFGTETEPFLSFESVRLLDGFVSYLAKVVEERSPGAQWQIGQHPNKRYRFRHHPVLAAAESQIFFAGPVVLSARDVVRGRTGPDRDEMMSYAEAVIDALNAGRNSQGFSEPLVEVEDLGDDPRRGRELELGFREDIAHYHSHTVDGLAKDLEALDGISGVLREDREVLLVATPTWTTSQLEEWAVDYLSKKLT